MAAKNEQRTNDQIRVTPQNPPLQVNARTQWLTFSGNREPALADLLTDPIVLRLMASDGIAASHLMALIDETRIRLAGR